MTALAPTPRLERVPFNRAVLVTPLDAEKPELKAQGANLSKSGMFVKSTEMFEPGTRVSLSLEAKGQAFPFAEAEVVWEAGKDNVIPGFGLRFVNFLHPRALELVDALLTKAAKKEKLEQFAAPPEKFTELSLADEAKFDKPLELELRPSVEVEASEPEAEAFEAPPIPRRTRTDPEFVRTGESLVIELQKEQPGADQDDDEDAKSRAAIKSHWPKMMGALAFLPLFLVPFGVALGTWRASRAPEPSDAALAAMTAVAPPVERTVEFAPPAQKPVVVDAKAPVISPAPTLMADASAPKLQKGVTLAELDPVPLVDAQPVDVPAKAPVEVAAKLNLEAPVKQVVAKAAPRAGEQPAKTTSSLPLQLAAVKSLSATYQTGALELQLALGSGASVRRAFALKSPDRLVIDIAGASAPKSAVHEFAAVSGISRVRVGALPDGVRLVVDLTSAASNVEVAGARVTSTLAR